MALEIERKFLVEGNYKEYAYAHEEIVQGYLSSVKERTVRVRIKGEKEISIKDARELLKLCEPGIIDKIRYYIKSGRHTFEVDEFNGENQGLVMAEIELSSENEQFEKPNWLREEVTGDLRYYNSSLTKLPYSKW